ncbi:uncharacterized protein LOC110440368 [Mizuhopecten yessoensis]|uniref:MAM domain-containing glycosylphosphatidylinositol anchor protein 2 n=1 Tax=Mizuhopecten yessoensis TaxID=6573 RepID=A0A210PLD7_MIZYE|nr:uncharacterized protein LOC110440368 [Mizuhopecten yessoensis]OWF37287.1 MAM domain-containing glycosylphosphatidylinositol anchor protein 2 [Mizuhopecten yessoensis]
MFRGSVLPLLCFLTAPYAVVLGDQTCGFSGQCQYDVFVDHCANTTKTRSVRDTSCACSDLNTIETEVDSLSSTVRKIQQNFESISSELSRNINALQAKKTTLQTLQHEKTVLQSQIQITDSSLNASNLRLEGEKELRTKEVSRLQAALSLTNTTLSSCKTALVTIQTQGTHASTAPDTRLIYCGFEDHNLCGFIQESSSTSWKQGKGSVSSTTGPLSDHTYGSVTGHYMYLDAAQVASYSSGQHVVRMTSPLLTPSTGYCLRFWYNMYGKDIETLNVYAKISGGSGLGNPVYVHSGQVDRNWHMAEVSLDSEYTSHSFSFMFEATTHAQKSSHYSSGHSYTAYTGEKGDIAIDDVYIYNTSCRHNDMSSCPAGSHLYHGGSNSSTNACYMVHVIPATWYDAAKACKEEAGNAHLVSINSVEEQTYLINLINADQGLKAVGQNGFYTSGNDERVEGRFEWTDQGAHLPVTYTDWHPGQPNNVGGDQDCLLMQYADNNYEWGDVACNEKHPFICEINK